MINNIFSNCRVAKTSSDKKIVSRESIGAKMQDSMKAGKIPDDSWIISLLGIAIKEVDESKYGWILVNFPRNSNQALLLEKELTGYNFISDL